MALAPSSSAATSTNEESDDDLCSYYSIDDKRGNNNSGTAASLTWHQGGVRELTFAYPTALTVADPATSLVPFLAAAVATTATIAGVSHYYSHCREEQLSTVYELLVAAPQMLEAVRPQLQTKTTSTARVTTTTQTTASDAVNYDGGARLP
jgi:hypothetical protein